jgi:hypothetical protein
MSYLPSDEWYKDLFKSCKTKKEVEDKAKSMIKYRDKEICEHEEKAITIVQGNVATIETLLNQMY